MSTPYPLYAHVIPELSIDKSLEYGVPLDLLHTLKKGMRVQIPIRNTLQTGYIADLHTTPQWDKVKPIHSILSQEELITEELFDLALWMSKYYCAPLRQVFKIILPSSVRKDVKHKQQLFVTRLKTKDELTEFCLTLRNKHPAQAAVLDVMLQVTKGILLTELLEKAEVSKSAVDSLVKKKFLDVDIVRVDRSPLINEEYFLTKAKKLHPEQAECLEKIKDSLSKQIFQTHLIFGVTGSGKTEVYLQAIEHALSLNKGVIMLVPEISLTSQTIERFRSRFEGHIAVLHHRLSDGERFDEWHKIKRNEAKIIIGARSAIFSPVVNLGLIIVDEEHEASYKQAEEAPCYNARDVAVMRAKLQKGTVILGSATPSLESYHNALQSKYVLSKLTSRAEKSQLPTVRIVDMREQFKKMQNFSHFSDPLLDSIKCRITNGEKTILFLNRRGYHTTLLCPDCQTIVKCQHCDAALTFHKIYQALSCHLCGFTIAPPPSRCKHCQSENQLKFRGAGTEQIERSLHAILPEIRTLRLDADTTRHKGSHQKLLKEFATGKADVLIGTQMIAKGLHFPDVTLVGVLNTDSGLNIPDFRSSETIFQLITQVAGRAGRGELPGEVIIQTCLPDNSVIKLASQQNFEEFYKEEIETRALFGFPPFVYLAKIAFSGLEETTVKSWAENFRAYLMTLLKDGFVVNPVVTSGHAKIKDRFKFQFIIRGHSMKLLTHAIEETKQKIPQTKDAKLLVDINPLTIYF